jgi:hypothetical protein
MFGKCLDVIMIARRSRHYAGTRYLKRGINVHGKAANDCEVEQVGPHVVAFRACCLCGCCSLPAYVCAMKRSQRTFKCFLPCFLPCVPLSQELTHML